MYICTYREGRPRQGLLGGRRGPQPARELSRPRGPDEKYNVYCDDVYIYIYIYT